MTEIIIVDNIQEDIDALSAIAEKSGLQAHCFLTAAEAWEQLEKLTPEFIVISNSLPDQGDILISKIRKNSNNKMPVAMIYDDDKMPLTENNNNKADFFITKPFSNSSLINIHQCITWMSSSDNSLLSEKEKIISEQQLEMEELQDQIEQAFTVSNQTAIEAEMAYIELNTIFRAVTNSIILINKDFEIMRFNQAYQDMTGKTREEIKGSKCHEIFPYEACGTDTCTVKQIVAGKKDLVQQELERKAEDGTTLHFSLTATPFKGPGGQLIGIVVYITDITENVLAKKVLEESHDMYKKMSIVDELTGLFNKRHFNKTLNFEIDRAERYGNPLSLVMMDIDNFKHHNDTFGHDEGDKVLGELGKIVADCVRSCDIACRYGGEEFAVILPETSGNDATVVAERIRKMMAETEFFPAPDEAVIKTLSLGIAQYTKGEKLAGLVRRTDKSLYKAKRAGKNRFCFEETA